MLAKQVLYHFETYFLKVLISKYSNIRLGVWTSIYEFLGRRTQFSVLQSYNNLSYLGFRTYEEFSLFNAMPTMFL
jgi:hypothetical protein